MSIFDINGASIVNSSINIFIDDIKKRHPSYNDDELLDEAIQEAKKNGKTSIIIYDGKDVHFSGQVTHECKGFGGIDFNNSKIYMPNYDNGVILLIVPDVSENLTISGSALTVDKVTVDSLKNKVFAVYGNNSGLELGTRPGHGTLQKWRPTLKTSPDGYYETGRLFLVPTEDNILFYNVHDYPLTTFILCNAKIVTYSSNNMSVFAKCRRSNTKISNFILEGRSQITSFHDGIFACDACFDLEICHISGIDPATKSLGIAYFLEISSVTNIYVHDCFVGDSESWAPVVGGHLMNTVFERCYLNKWDSHYCQTGYHHIRNCVLNCVQYGVGTGVMNIENCTFVNNETSQSVLYSICLRTDMVGVYEGDVIVKNCTFYRGEQSENLFVIWRDTCVYEKPSNSVLNSNPNAGRYIEKCKMPDGCKNVFVIGTTFSSDKEMYENINVSIKDTEVICSDTIFESADSIQDKVGSVLLDNCIVIDQCYLTKNLSNTPITVDKCDFGSNALKITSNSSEIHVTNTKLSSIISDNTSEKLVANGNVFSGSQSIAMFNSYALSNNIASDMNSVNKHS